jgi:hypothetical protein
MCKAIDREMIITDISLIKKSGGKSGDFTKSGSGECMELTKQKTPFREFFCSGLI